MQERLTKEIAEAVLEAIQPTGVGVVIEATLVEDSDYSCISPLLVVYLMSSNVLPCRHMCMTMRGINKPQNKTVTSSMIGVFRDDPRTREEFLTLVKSTK